MTFRCLYAKGNNEPDAIIFHEFLNENISADCFEQAKGVADELLTDQYGTDYTNLPDWKWFEENESIKGFAKRQYNGQILY